MLHLCKYVVDQTSGSLLLDIWYCAPSISHYYAYNFKRTNVSQQCCIVLFYLLTLFYLSIVIYWCIVLFLHLQV